MKDGIFTYIKDILDFYRDSNLSSSFIGNVFQEGNSEEQVLSKLERAAKDEADGHLLHSRYAIWASGVNDLIQNAMKAVQAKDFMRVQKQLILASNAIQAYRDIQAIFNNDFYKPVDIFGNYVSYLLKADDLQSTVIDKNGIAKILKDRSGSARVNLPRAINFSIKNGVLRVFVKNVTHNMQENSASFEGWILILKSWLSNEIKFVELDFLIPEGITTWYGSPISGHYNKFLYRTYNFLRLYPQWFFLNSSKTSILSDFMQRLHLGKCLLNHSLREIESVIGTEKTERKIESWFVYEDGKKPLCELWDIDEHKLFNQLPIGVFNKIITTESAIFTRGASAIDIWGIGNDRQTLHLIELKCGTNKKIGVISEVLFYTAIIFDTCLSDKRLFAFGRYGNAQDTSDMIALKNGGIPFGRLSAHILAEQYHPLFDQKVVAAVQEGLSSLSIDFSRAAYDYSRKALIDEYTNI